MIYSRLHEAANAVSAEYADLMDNAEKSMCEGAIL